MAALLAANVVFAAPQPAIAAPTVDQAITQAWGLYFQGKALTARKALADFLETPPAAAGAPRLAVLRAILDMCVQGQADACVLKYAKLYIDTEKLPATVASPADRERVRLHNYYFGQARMAVHSLEMAQLVIAEGGWKHENAFNAPLYLKRQTLLAQALVTVDDYAGAARSVDRTLSLIASLENPQDDRLGVARALADAIGVLVQMGETERAYGLYRASGEYIFKTLPPLTMDAVGFRVTEAGLLESRGDLEGAAGSLQLALTAIDAMEMDDDVRESLLTDTLTARAAACAGRLDLDCARAALQRHPLAGRFEKPGVRAQTYRETAFLTVRAMVNAFGAGDDPVAAQALAGPAPTMFSATTNRELAVYRSMGAALAAPPGAARAPGLLEGGRLLVSYVEQAPSAGFGAWHRPGGLEQTLIVLALTQAGVAPPEADETIFALMQLAGRQGPTLDADALTLLGQTRDGMQRRALHQALRLRARRDQFERTRLSAMATQAMTGAHAGGPLRHDLALRSRFRDFAERISTAETDLAHDGIAASGANLVPLRRLQAVLEPDEAALTVAVVPGGLAYMCVRSDATMRKLQAGDLRQAALDARILQSALTAGYAPNEALDSQYPVAAATRLYDLFIRPFDGCLKPGDHILWLPNAAITSVPLAALLEHAPPKLGRGYDLAGAAWLIADHSISYAGSASAIVAARTGNGVATDFDFLGVGDPVLSGQTATGEDRTEIVMRGVRGAATLASLAALPETKTELEVSAKGFQQAKVLTGAAATEAEVRGQLLGSYQYLSFATHGLLRDDLQGLAEPALALTPVSSTDSTDDGLLTASEIADLNLAARFVALSACNTANFDMSQMSQDLPALASAFAVAGTPATLGTLWPVDSKTGEAVVSQLFVGLRRDAQPALALAQAQRAFLAAPPGRAYLHPRFWAPFVVLGDGGAETPPHRPADILSADVLTTAGGQAEVLALRRDGRRVLAGYIEGGGSGVRAADGKSREIWRQDDGVFAGRVLLTLGSKAVVGGQAKGAGGRVVPSLQAFNKTSGRPAGEWRGLGQIDRNVFMVAGANLDDAHAVVMTVEAGGPAVILRGLALDDGLEPAPLFEVTTPAATLNEATISQLGENLLITYTQREPPPGTPTQLGEDDFELPDCLPPPITWVEVRNAKTGALVDSMRLDGWTIAASLVREGRAFLAGGYQRTCAGKVQAGALRLDQDLTPSLAWLDTTAGTSEVRGVAGLSDGRIFIAARKANVLDYAGDRKKSEVTYSGMLTTIGPDGAASAPRMLDSGGDLFVFTVEGSDPDDILVGGSLGDQATIFHLTRR